LERCRTKLEEAGAEVETITLAGKTIKPCIACMRCKVNQDRACAQRGDDFAPILESLLQADVIVVGSPVYFGSATPQLMALLDRAGYVSKANGNLFTRKVGGPVVVARRAGQNFTFAQLVMWFLINDMVVPGSTYWNVAFGREEGEVRDDAEGVATVDRFADNLVWAAANLTRESVGEL
jgi:multimeric flavodoxin WrbA